MSDDWRPGDLALCVNTGDMLLGGALRVGGRCLREGAPYSVVAVYRDIWGVICLRLAEVASLSDRRGFPAARFRKIRPHTPDAEDAETIALLTGKPAKVTA